MHEVSACKYFGVPLFFVSRGRLGPTLYWAYLRAIFVITENKEKKLSFIAILSLQAPCVLCSYVVYAVKCTIYPRVMDWRSVFVDVIRCYTGRSFTLTTSWKEKKSSYERHIEIQLNKHTPWSIAARVKTCFGVKKKEFGSSLNSFISLSCVTTVEQKQRWRQLYQ